MTLVCGQEDIKGEGIPGVMPSISGVAATGAAGAPFVASMVRFAPFGMLCSSAIFCVQFLIYVRWSSDYIIGSTERDLMVNKGVDEGNC